MSRDMCRIKWGDQNSHISFDSPESRSESKHLVGAGESARGKGKKNSSFEENDTRPPLEGYDLATVNSI